MITITTSHTELFDSEKEEFIIIPEQTFRFEHSLHAIAQWEAKYKVPYMLAVDPKSECYWNTEQQLDYFKFMCVTPGFTEQHATYDVIEKLSNYISDPATATTISNQNGSSGSGSIMTSESIYALMVVGNIPFECEYWNFNRLIVLINVVASHHAPKKKMTRQEIFEQNRRLNEERKQKYNTKG